MLRTDEEERIDREAEAEHWRNYDASKGNCLMVFIGLIVAASGVVSLPILMLA